MRFSLRVLSRRWLAVAGLAVCTLTLSASLALSRLRPPPPMSSYAFVPERLVTGDNVMTSAFPSAIDETLQAALWAHHNEPATAACPTHKRVLVAIPSTAHKSAFALRSLVRTFARFARPVSTVDVLFVVGRPRFYPWDADHYLRQMAGLRLEQAQYGDIILLDMEENMNDGKTYMLFKTIHDMARAGTGRSYDYVFKADDDTFVHYSHLVAYLDALTANATANATSAATNMYIGRQLKWGYPNIYPSYAHSGMAYGLSWDLVQWIATSPIPRANMVGHEDRMTGQWLAASGRPIKYISNEVDWFLHPWGDAALAWTSSYTPNAVAIHDCKDIDRHMDAALHYYRRWLVGRDMVYRMDNTPDCRLSFNTIF